MSFMHKTLRLIDVQPGSVGHFDSKEK